jgi:hypothetical protein
MTIFYNDREKVAFAFVLIAQTADIATEVAKQGSSNLALSVEATSEVPLIIVMLGAYVFAHINGRREIANGVVVSRFALVASKAITSVPYSQFHSSYIPSLKISWLAIAALLPQAYLARMSSTIGANRIRGITIFILVASAFFGCFLDGDKGTMTFVDVNTGMLVRNASCGSVFEAKGKDYFDSGEFWIFCLTCVSLATIGSSFLAPNTELFDIMRNAGDFLAHTFLLTIMFMVSANFLFMGSVQQNNCNENAYLAGGTAFAGGMFYLGRAAQKILSEIEEQAPMLTQRWLRGGEVDASDIVLEAGEVVGDEEVSDSSVSRASHDSHAF